MTDIEQTEDKDFAAELEREYKRRGDELARSGKKISMLTDIFSNEDLLRFVARLLTKKGGSLTRARETVNAVLTSPARCPKSLWEKYDLVDLRIFHPQFLRAVRTNLQIRSSVPDAPKLYDDALNAMLERSEKAKQQYAGRGKNDSGGKKSKTKNGEQQ